MEVTLNTSILTFKNLDHYFVYDAGTGIVCESADTVNSVLNIISRNQDKNRALELLKKMNLKDNGKEELTIINEMLKSGLISYQNSPGPVKKRYNIPQEDWDQRKVLKNLCLLLTQECNLNCVYCYEKKWNPDERIGFMTKDIAKKSIDYWFDYLDRDAKKVTVTFYGGEPLLNKEVLVFAVDYINDLMRNTNKKVKYLISTNGTLMDDEIINVFIKNNFDITLSVDGDEKTHNKNRPDKAGIPSFQRVRSNLERIKELDKEQQVNIIARMTVTKENIHSFKEDVISIWNLGVYSVYYEVTESKPNNYPILLNYYRLFKEQLEELTNLIYENMVQGNGKEIINIIEPLTSIHKKKNRETCLFYKPFSILFNPNGDIYKCTWSIGNMNYHSGNLETGLDYKKFNNPVVEDESCLNCWARKLCSGVCVFKDYGESKRNEAFKTRCMFKKLNIKESLRLYTIMYIKDKKMLNKYTD